MGDMGDEDDQVLRHSDRSAAPHLLLPPAVLTRRENPLCAQDELYEAEDQLDKARARREDAMRAMRADVEALGLRVTRIQPEATPRCCAVAVASASRSRQRCRLIASTYLGLILQASEQD